MNLSPANLTARAQQAPWNQCIELMLHTPTHVVTDLTLVPGDPSIRIAPSVTLSTTAAQTLMDDLWHCGVRPTEGSGSAGAMRATERHLADLQRLVFDRDEEQPPHVFVQERQRVKNPTPADYGSITAR